MQDCLEETSFVEVVIFLSILFQILSEYAFHQGLWLIPCKIYSFLNFEKTIFNVKQTNNFPHPQSNNSWKITG